MGRISEAIAAAQGGDMMPLLEAARDLPSNGIPTDDFDYDGAGPSNDEGESFNTITAAWIADKLSDEQYKTVVKVAEAARQPADAPVQNTALDAAANDLTQAVAKVENGPQL